jgi:heavy metal sensor kinase
MWYVAIFAVAQIVFGIAMWLSLRHHLFVIVDNTLLDQVEDVRSFFEAQKKDATVAKLREEATEEYNSEHSGEYLEIYDEKGNEIYRSSFFRQISRSSESLSDVKPLYSIRALSGKSLRVLSCPVRVREHTFFVRIGTPFQDVQDTLAAFRRYLLMLAPFVLAVAAAGGYALSRRALAPVDLLTRTARTITGSSLSSRLKKLNTGDELQRLSDTLNEMLDRIEAAFRKISEFTADASHELRTPVSLIRTEAELTLRRSRDSQEYRVALAHILTEAERTTRLLEQLLSIARADAGRESLDIKEVDLRAVIEEAGAAWGGVARGHGRQLTTDMPSVNVPVHGDESALRRLIDILLDNAMKYTNTGGQVTLTLAREGNVATVYVQDDGIGIPGGELEKVFDRFYRVDKARSRSQGCAGLGLAIARWIVQQHHGEIRVTSAPVLGSTFEVKLPLNQQEYSTALQADPGGVHPISHS